MATPFENFQSWYSNIIRSLYEDRNAGFVILLGAFPLLERYGRHKAGLTFKDDLKDPFHDELVCIFPEFTNRERSKEVWNVYRNGLLHTVTLCDETRRGMKLPVSWLSHDNELPFFVDNTGSFWLNPVPFADRVLNTIENDFLTFEVGRRAGAPFPRVYENVPPVNLGRGTTFTGVATGIVTGTALPQVFVDVSRKS